MMGLGLDFNISYTMIMIFFKKNIYEIILLVYIFGMLVFPSVIYSQVTPPCTAAGKICNPIDSSTIQEFIRILLEGVLKIGIPVVALAVIYCGFLFVKARGKSEELTKAKDALWYTLIGAAILLGSWAIAKLISETVLSIGS